jgi:hypothetical protein
VTRAFRWYLGGVGSWFAGYGVANILFPWLVAVVLHESPHHPDSVPLAERGYVLPSGYSSLKVKL